MTRSVKNDHELSLFMSIYSSQRSVVFSQTEGWTETPVDFSRSETRVELNFLFSLKALSAVYLMGTVLDTCTIVRSLLTICHYLRCVQVQGNKLVHIYESMKSMNLHGFVCKSHSEKLTDV